jgi:hypothetical protein
VSSREGSCQTSELASVSEGLSNQADWRAIVVANLVWETELLPGWETEPLPSDSGVC